MTEVIYLDEHSQPIESDKEIRAALDEITDILAAMTKEQRIPTQSILKKKLTVLYIR